MHRLPSIALAATVALVSGCECQPADPPAGGGAVRVAPTPAGKPAAPKADGLYASPHRLGPLSASVLPTVEAIDEKLPEKYTVRAAGEGALPGVTVEVLVGDEVVLEIFPSADKTRIERAVARGGHVIFPWNTKVGMKASDQKNWTRMSCQTAPAPFEGHAICNAFAEGRVGYLLKGWEGDPKVVPAAEVLGELTIAGMLWTPDAAGPPKAGEKPAGEKGDKAGKPGEKPPKVIQLVPLEE